MEKKLLSIDGKKLKQDFNVLIREFYSETGEYPSRIHLVAEGHSRFQVVKVEIKKQIY